MPPRVEALLMRLPGCARLGTDALALLAAAARTQEYPPATRLVTECLSPSPAR